MTLRGPSVAMGRAKMLLMRRRDLVPLRPTEGPACAAGVETKVGDFSNLLMARDF
jgi:hypothetical protein